MLKTLELQIAFVAGAVDPTFALHRAVAAQNAPRAACLRGGPHRYFIDQSSGIIAALREPGEAVAISNVARHADRANGAWPAFKAKEHVRCWAA